MDTTPNLNLPYILAAQSQKHVTHNEALRSLDAIVQLSVADRDLVSPPTTPANGARHIVPGGASGAWVGQTGKIAAYQDGAWVFYAPSEGWLAWVRDEDKLITFDGATWSVVGGGTATVNPTPLVGVNATADTANRLAVASPASLFNHDGGDHQLKINKAAAVNTASVVFQDAFSGRAEFGLSGDDDFRVKVSADGSVWKEAIVVERSTGRVRMPLTAGRTVLTANRTYFVSPSGNDGTNDGLTAGSPLQTIAKAYSIISSQLDLAGFAVTIQLADGTYAAGLAIQKAWLGGGSITLKGNATTPANVVITPGAFGAYGVYVDAPLVGVLTVQDLKLACAATGLQLAAPGLIRFANVDFGACGAFHMTTESPGAKIQAAGGYKISGGAQVHWVANGQGLIEVAGKVVTLTGTPAFSTAFAYATPLSQIQGYANTYSGSATGPRYLVDGNSLIFTNSGGANVYPGSTAGAVATGGQYV